MASIIDGMIMIIIGFLMATDTLPIQNASSILIGWGICNMLFSKTNQD